MMEELKLKAIVLSATNYKEKDVIINLFSLEQGKISAMLKSVRTQKAKLKFATQPFCFGDFILVKKGANFVVTSATQEESFFELTKDYEAYKTAFSILEVVNVSLMESQQSTIVFVNLLKALKLITYDKITPKLVLLKFITGMLKVLGYRPNFNTCDACGLEFVNKKYLNLSTGSFNCGSCVTPDCKLVGGAEFKALKILNNTPIEKLNTINFTGETINTALKLMVLNFENRVNRKLKTITC